VSSPGAVIDPGHRGRGRRGRGALLGAILMAVVGVAAGQPNACGRPGYGLSYSAEPEISGGRFATELVMTDAPTPTLDFLLAIVVDGRSVDAPAPIRLACHELSLYRQAIPEPEHRVHWALLRWPLLPKSLTGIPPEGVMEAHATIPFRQTRPAPLVEVAYPKRPSDADRWPYAAPSTRVALNHPGDSRREDGVAWIPPSFGPAPPDAASSVVIVGSGSLARAPVGTELPFELSLYSSEGSGGPLAFICLLNGRHIDAFGGHPYVTATAVAGGTLIARGEIEVPGPGWHQLQCLALDDDPPGTHPTSFMRPLDEAYVWGE
jgi:hypothetical protein